MTNHDEITELRRELDETRQAMHSHAVNVEHEGAGQPPPAWTPPD